MKIGIISGVHEDIIRLEKALTLLKKRGCDTLVCLGDIVGYSVPYYGYFNSRNAHKVVQLIKDNCKYAVAGNHDLFAVNKTPRMSIFEYPDNWHELSYFEKTKISNGKVWIYGDELPVLLEKEDEEYLKCLPEYLAPSFGDLKIMFSHYAKPNLIGDHTQWDAAKDGLEEHFDFMRRQGCQISFFGHDLQNGVRIFHKDSKGSVKVLPFGKHPLNSLPVALNGPWVANGTMANGFLILDTGELSVESIPLNTTPHKIPDWFDK